MLSKTCSAAAAILALTLFTAAAQNMDADGPPVALLPNGGGAQTGDTLLQQSTSGVQPPALQNGSAPVLTNVSQPAAVNDASSGGAAPPWSGYAAAESMAANGNPDIALRQLNARLAQAPEDAKAAYLKGLILMQLGQAENAERWFKMMQANFPDLPQPYNALAVIYTGKGDLLAAESTLQALLAQHPNYRPAQINLANIYVKLAKENYQKANKAKADKTLAGKLQALETIDKQPAAGIH